MPERIEDVAILIAGERWSAWESVEISLGLDSFSAVSFTSPFEPSDPRFRETFRPFTYKPLEVQIGGERVFTGTLVDTSPSATPKGRKVGASAYAKPAVLEDCTPPMSAWPLELNGLGLHAIATTLAAPFGITVAAIDDEGAAFRRVAIRPDEPIHGFLSGLALQRGLVIADTSDGRLRFLRSVSTPSIVDLTEGEAPLQDVSASFSPQAYYSEMTGRSQARSGRAGGGHTEQNPHLADVMRPTGVTLEDTDGPDAEAATRAKLGRMFGNAAAVVVALPTWRDPSGVLWTPGSTVSLEAPGAMIYRRTEFVIRQVTLTQDAAHIGATLELALPGCFSGEIPDSLPWGP